MMLQDWNLPKHRDTQHIYLLRPELQQKFHPPDIPREHHAEQARLYIR